MTDQLFLERAIKKYGDPHKSGRYPVWEFGEGKEKRKVTLKRRSLILTAWELGVDFEKLIQAYVDDEVNKKPAETTF